VIRRALLLVVALAALVASHGSSRRAEAAKNAEADPDELRYLPEGRILRIASLGHSKLVADLVWLQAIQYYGEQRLTTRNYEQTARFFDAIYDLDPTFMAATRFGALILSQDAGDPASALRLLSRAEHDHPDAWQYPFDEGFIHHTIRRDYQAAGEAYRRAAAHDGAPQLAVQLAGASFGRLGDRETARGIWWALLGDENPMTRSLAERSLKNLDLEEVEENLTEAVRTYRSEHGGIPKNWEVLQRAGLIGKMPKDPWGGRLLWVEENEEVLSSTTIDRRMAAIRDIFQGLVHRAREEGSPPESLQALVERGEVASPWSPFGLKLDYDTHTGEVAWNPPWPATEPRRQGTGKDG
jgi:tetratricopeptide (TPR) repeat protein